MRPVRASFDHDQTDSLDRVLEIGRRHGLALSAQTTFTGIGQGLSPRRWRKRLLRDAIPWTVSAGRERLDSLCAALAGLPDQDRSPHSARVAEVAAHRTIMRRVRPWAKSATSRFRMVPVDKPTLAELWTEAESRISAPEK